MTCPSCGTVLSAPDAAAGKRAKCRTCQTILTIPNPQQPGLDIIDEATTVAEMPLPPQGASAFGFDEPAPMAKKRQADDDDEKPRSKKRGPEKKGNALVYVLGAAVALLLFLIVGSVGVYWFAFRKVEVVEATAPFKARITAPTRPAGKTPPKDWEVVDDSDFQVWLPTAGILNKDDGRLPMMDEYPDLGELRYVDKIVRTDPFFRASMYVIYIRPESVAKANADPKETLGEWSSLFLIKISDVDVSDFNNNEFKYQGRLYTHVDERRRKHFWRMFIRNNRFYVLHVLGDDINERSEYVKTFFDSFNPTK